MQKQPLILTLKLDAGSQAFFNKQRKLYFPAERNYLDAHLTLFHQLPDEQQTYDYFGSIAHTRFDINVVGLISLGRGVAYKIESEALQVFRSGLAQHFAARLIPQDKQSFRPHVTIMNKSTPEAARSLLARLSEDFEPFAAQAIGFDLWIYENGPWKHCQSYKLV